MHMARARGMDSPSGDASVFASASCAHWRDLRQSLSRTSAHTPVNPFWSPVTACAASWLPVSYGSANFLSFEEE